jgi:protein-S-isoprenylcysteine O-methyltransferase Ste14
MVNTEETKITGHQGLGLLLVALQMALIVAIAWPTGVWAWSWAAAGVMLAGVALGAWTLWFNRPGNFDIRPQVKPSAKLILTGPYRYLRHPMYSTVLLGSTGLVLFHPAAWRWLALAMLFAVLCAKAMLEERSLGAKFPEYANYARRVRRFVPYLF